MSELLLSRAEVMELRDNSAGAFTGFQAGEKITFTKTPDGKYLPSGGENRTPITLQQIANFVVDDEKLLKNDCIDVTVAKSVAKLLQEQAADNEEIVLPGFEIVGRKARGATAKFLAHPELGEHRIAAYKAMGIETTGELFPVIAHRKGDSSNWFKSENLVVKVME